MKSVLSLCQGLPEKAFQPGDIHQVIDHADNVIELPVQYLAGLDEQRIFNLQLLHQEQ